MKRTVPRVRILREIVRNADMPHLRMQHSVNHLAIHDGAPADTSPHRQINEVGNPPPCTPTRLSRGGSVDVGIEAHGNIESARYLACQIELLPARLRGGCDETESRRVRPQIDGTERSDPYGAHRRPATLAKKCKHLPERFLWRRSRKRREFQVV